MSIFKEHDEVIEIKTGEPMMVLGEDRGWILCQLADGGTKKFRDKQLAEQICTDEQEQEQGDELTVGQKMAKQLREAKERYVKQKSYSGKASANNGDDLAQLLAGCTPTEAMLLADLVMEDCDEDGWKSTQERYAHLNAGQKRMNSGNLIRARVKKGLISIDQVAEHYAAMVPPTPEDEEA